jgi:UDP-N-acetylglucosamine 2-epimerase (non-hydrolysing)
MEAGLRTGNALVPFPEEANRRMVAPLASLHFANTERARDNLLREGIAAEAIHVTGSTAIDSLRIEIERQERPEVGRLITDQLSHLVGFDVDRERFVLITGHRRVSFGKGFEQITEAIRRLAEQFGDHHFVYPVHLNPLVQEPVHGRLGHLANVHLVAPQDYPPFVALMRMCELVLTDSGGMQEEAPSLAKPVLVMRETTERPEGVDTGNAMLVGVDSERIVRATATLLTDPVAHSAMAQAAQPYGDGHAAPRIVDAIVRHAAAASPVERGSLASSVRQKDGD